MKEPRKRIAASALSAALLLSGATFMLSCERDILTGQPSYLGNSIYERLQDEGNYQITLRLIDDLNQTNVFSQTGSKTLFAADDDAFQAFFSNNDWGVTKYEDLTMAQKKLLLNSAMVNNAYLVELLSSVSADENSTKPMEGKCMRRETAVSVYDSVPRIYPENMPNTEFWAQYKSLNDGMLLLRDNTSKPMIHFLPVFMRMNDITDTDLQIITNGESSSTADAWVNGKKIIERDITCKNGYIHKVDGVMTSSGNMAEIINSTPGMERFSLLLNRFCAPYPDEESTKEYDRLYNSNEKVYTLKYFATRETGSTVAAPDGSALDAELLFDPGWNQYIYANTSGVTLQYDAGAMLVPSNDAIDYYWDNDGKVLQDMYGSWDKVPLKVLAKLVNTNMVSTFVETVPSKFKNIVDNTTKVSLGIEPSNVIRCYMGCNGVVYLIDKVFAPADYSSVSFPALVNEKTMNVIYWAISTLEFEPYLNSMDSYYSFFIPTNTALLRYVDPCSYGKSVQVLYEFYYDNDTKSVKARRYGYDLATNTVRPEVVMEDASDTQVQNRLTDLLDNLIVVGNVEDGHTYYKTKGGSMLKVANAGVEGMMTVSGGLQIAQDQPLRIDTIYDQTVSGNGKSYIVSSQMPMASPKSVYSMLKEHEEYSEFYNLIAGSKLLSQKLSSDVTCTDYNISLFDAYNYTVYVPTNEAIRKLHEDGILPTKEDYDNLTAADFGGDAQKLKKAKEFIQDRMLDFLRYHIQDNSVMIGGSSSDNVKYETFKMNPAINRFYSLTVSADDNELTLTDQLGNQRKVVKTEGLYNNLCRDVWIQTKSGEDNIYNASDAVVHSIDGALFYDSSQLTKWKEEIENL